MKYTVVWLPDAERELAKLYLQIPTALMQAFSRAANQIDAELRNQPLDIGRKINELRAILNHDPLAVAYAVFPDDRLVQITAVWLHET